MNISVLPNNVDQQKHKRLKKQAAKLAAIQAHPEDLWVDLLLEHWPQFLPQYVICRLFEQGYAEYVQEHNDVVGSRDHFKNLDQQLDQMKDMMTEDVVVDLYKTLAINNPQALLIAQDMMNFIASLPHPVQVTVVSSDVPLMMAMKHVGAIDHPEEEKMISETRSRPHRFWIDEKWTQDQQKHFEGTIVASLAYKGGVQIRHPLVLRVQRPNQHGVLEWVAQEKIYGFSLIQGQVIPLSVQQLTQAHCTGPNGEHWPLEAGTHIGNTVKEFEAFKKRK